VPGSWGQYVGAVLDTAMAMPPATRLAPRVTEEQVQATSHKQLDFCPASPLTINKAVMAAVALETSGVQISGLDSCHWRHLCSQIMHIAAEHSIHLFDCRSVAEPCCSSWWLASHRSIRPVPRPS
jgi:hypothetical protein